MADTPPALGRRWRLPGVRGLMALILIVGGVLGWLEASARTQREAVAAIKRAGGTFYYSYELGWQGDFVDRGTTEPGWPRWLVRAVGIDHLDHIIEVAGRLSERFDDSTMIHVGRLRELESLRLDDCRNVTDIGMRHLGRLPRLRNLNLTRTGIKGPGLVALKGMPNLELLILTDLPLTDVEMTYLADLPKVRTLDLQGTKMTDAALDHLPATNSLGLLVAGRGVTQAGVTMLARKRPKMHIHAPGARYDPPPLKR